MVVTGHLYYTTSVRLCLQQILELPTTHPDVYDHFALFRHHTIHRKDRTWTGVWNGVVIEQVMMSSIESVGGSKRGRGFTENISHWIIKTHHFAVILDRMAGLSNLQLAASEQHIEMIEVRRLRDVDDCKKLYGWHKDHS